MWSRSAVGMVMIEIINGCRGTVLSVSASLIQAPKCQLAMLSTPASAPSGASSAVVNRRALGLSEIGNHCIYYRLSGDADKSTAGLPLTPLWSLWRDIDGSVRTPSVTMPLKNNGNPNGYPTRSCLKRQSSFDANSLTDSPLVTWCSLLSDRDDFEKCPSRLSEVSC
jgi:hypothetical protein